MSRKHSHVLLEWRLEVIESPACLPADLWKHSIILFPDDPLSDLLKVYNHLSPQEHPIRIRVIVSVAILNRYSLSACLSISIVSCNWMKMSVLGTLVTFDDQEGI